MMINKPINQINAPYQKRDFTTDLFTVSFSIEEHLLISNIS
jgi:hypothetical protein